jgi:GDP-4-dehydro-6-deoxy-D-mannose reductase
MIGKHLATELSSHGYDVAGISRATSASRYMPAESAYRHFAGDILDRAFLTRVWDEWQPEVVFHLAAQAYNGVSWEAEDTTYLLNIEGSRNIFKVCREKTPSARIIPACSSAQYGFVDESLLPISEDTPLHPITPYGVSKTALEMMAYQNHVNYGTDIVIPRLFIHVGPDHPPVTALQNFARQLAQISKGAREPVVRVGNLESSRDFVDVRDGVAALRVLAEKGKTAGTYNICSGTAWNIGECLDMFVSISGQDVQIVQDERFLRPSDEKVLVGDRSRLRELGWETSTPFESTLRDIYDNWLERV